MVTVNSVLRSMAAEAKRQNRAAIRRQKELAKLEILQQAEYEVEEHENRISLLQSFHQDCSSVWNWESILNSSPPQKPTKERTHESNAMDAFDSYTPTMGDKVFRKIKKKKVILEEKILEGEKKDEEEFQSKLKKYNVEFEEWNDIKKLAERILSGDLEGYKDAFDQINPFSEISGIGSSVSFSFIDAKTISVQLNVNSQEVIPAEEKRVLKSGKLSTKKMPISRYNEIYQDYVCSGVLRIARECFAILPFDTVYVTAISELLNSQTGHIEKSPILSVMIPRSTLDKINFDAIDPSDSMRNFIHSMKFKKTIGFEVVEEIKPEK